MHLMQFSFSCNYGYALDFWHTRNGSHSCKWNYLPFHRKGNQIRDWSLNSLPNNRILNWSKLKAFANDKINMAKKLKFVLRRVENVMGKGENAGYQHFLLFPQCFQTASFSGSLKVGIVC